MRDKIQALGENPSSPEPLTPLPARGDGCRRSCPRSHFGATLQLFASPRTRDFQDRSLGFNCSKAVALGKSLLPAGGILSLPVSLPCRQPREGEAHSQTVPSCCHPRRLVKRRWQRASWSCS